MDEAVQEERRPSLRQLMRRLRRAIDDGNVAVAKRLDHRISQQFGPEHFSQTKEIPLRAPRRDGPSDRPFVFVSGTPRSGTTAVGRLLKSDPRVAMFTEVYSPVLGYTPSMFDREILIELRDAGLIPNLSLYGNDKILENLDTARVVGDKRPHFMRSAQLTLSRFKKESVTIFHIVRNPYNVAHSYAQRARNGQWHPTRDHTVAVAEMNMNSRNALELLDRPQSDAHKLFILRYETFWAQPENASVLFDHLGLSDETEARRSGVATMFQNAMTISARDRALSVEETAFVEQNLDWSAHEALCARAVV